jgi:uncharacterized membrane protein YjjB (DUF3815 family)
MKLKTCFIIMAFFCLTISIFLFVPPKTAAIIMIVYCLSTMIFYWAELEEYDGR